MSGTMLSSGLSQCYVVSCYQPTNIVVTFAASTAGGGEPTPEEEGRVTGVTE